MIRTEKPLDQNQRATDQRRFLRWKTASSWPKAMGICQAASRPN